MIIRGSNFLQQLMYERDSARLDFVNKEKELFDKYGNKYHKLKTAAQKYAYLCLYIFIGYCFILLLLYKKFNEKLVIIYSIIGAIITLSFLVYAIIVIIKKNKYKSIWDKAEESLLKLKEETRLLNEKVAKVALAVICLSENYQELQQINDTNKLHMRWLVLLSQYRDGINLLHHNNATVEDYINYYRKWAESKAK